MQILKVESAKKEETVEKLLKPTRKPKYDTVPEGYHWFRVTPYEDGIIPYDKVDTILIYKKDAENLLYVGTCNSPADLTDLGYLYPESPVTIWGRRKVFFSTIFPQFELEAVLVDLTLDTNLFINMPNHSCIIFYLEHFSRELLQKILKNFDKLPVSNRYYNYVNDVLFKGDLPRSNEKVFFIKISIASPSRETFQKLKRLLLTSINLDTVSKDSYEYWPSVLESATQSQKSLLKIFKKDKVPFTSSVDTLRNWLFVPPNCPTIPRGTIPAKVLSKPNGFRIGKGLDSSELRLSVEDFLNHCVIVNPNPDLLANLIKNIGQHYPVVVLSPISYTLLQKGIKCRVYEQATVNVLDDLSKLPSLVKVLDTLGIDHEGLESAVTTIHENLGSVSYSAMYTLQKYNQYRISCKVNQEVFKAIETILSIPYLGLEYTNFPTDVLFNGVTVFENPSPELLIKVLTEAVHAKKHIFIVLDDPYPLTLLNFRNVSFILCLRKPDVNVGIVFKVENDKALVETEKGSTLITIDKFGSFPVTPLPSPTLPKPSIKLDHVVGPAIKFIDPIFPIASLKLYEIYKKGKVKVKDLNDEILNFLKNLDAITVQGDYVQYNDGFEKWFKPAIPSIESFKIVRAIIDYYFPKKFCVVPVKQTPKIERPDLLAIPFNESFDCFNAIPIEVELSLNKGEKSLQQTLKNMSKNPEFPVKHVITHVKFKDTILKLHDQLEDKSRVKILFFDGEKISENPFVDLTEPKEKQPKEKRKSSLVSNPKSIPLTQFLKPEPKTEPKTTTKKQSDVTKKEDECEGIILNLNNKKIVLEKSPKSERILKLIKERKVKIVKKGDVLKVVDEKGIVLAQAKILKVY